MDWSLLTHFSGLISLLQRSEYAFLFLGTFLEGPLVMMSSGFLFRLGQFSFWPMYLALVAGDFVADIAWYFVGRLLARPFILRWGYWLNITQEAVTQMEHVFKNYDLWILAISKLTMGFGLALATLTTAGMLECLWCGMPPSI